MGTNNSVDVYRQAHTHEAHSTNCLLLNRPHVACMRRGHFHFNSIKIRNILCEETTFSSCKLKYCWYNICQIPVISQLLRICTIRFVNKYPFADVHLRILRTHTHSTLQPYDITKMYAYTYSHINYVRYLFVETAKHTNAV